MTLSNIGQTNETSAVLTLHNSAGFFHAQDYGLLKITGKDAATFLQSQLTNDIKALSPGTSQFNCLLDRKAHVESYFHLFRDQNSTAPAFYALGEKELLLGLIHKLEQYRFAADVDFVDCSNEGTFFAVQGSRANRIFSFLQEDVYLNAIANVDNCDIAYSGTAIKLFRHSICGENGYLFWINNSDYSAFSHVIESACKSFGFYILDDTAVSAARIEAGVLKYGVDFDSSNLLPETGLLEQTVNYQKGCFIGQEVLARVRSHGIPAKAIIGLVLQSKGPSIQELTINSPIIAQKEEIGILKSNVLSPKLEKLVGFAYLKRDYRIPDKEFVVTINGLSFLAKATILPFAKPQSNKDVAQTLYQQAVQDYVNKSENELPLEAIALLREALILDPSFDDAYEALAVILSKHNKIDEAINIMKTLAQLNPDSVMAHSNLSQFYVLQGLKEAAEEEKAIALSIRMRLAAAQFANKAKQNEDAQKEEADRLKRKQMFEQVLEIDKEDFFANAGLGECLVAQSDFAKAIPYLKKAIELKAIHLPAYIDLAKAYKASDYETLAKETLNTAIAIASKRGDMKALQDLQEELKSLIDKA